jgi:hypothetical protein
VPLPRCGRCDMFVPDFVLRSTHPDTKRCQEGADRKQKRNLELENLVAQETVFAINGVPLENVDSFKYLGHLVTVNDSDTPAVLNNIHKARGCWAQGGRVLAQEGAAPKVSAMFYKAVVQSVLLFSCETWVGTRAIMSVVFTTISRGNYPDARFADVQMAMDGFTQRLALPLWRWV